MKSFLKIGALVLALASLQACTRIETGEVGLRVGFDKQVKNDELLPGSFNQTLVGDVLTFPVKEVAVKVDDLNPQAGFWWRRPWCTNLGSLCWTSLLPVLT